MRCEEMGRVRDGFGHNRLWAKTMTTGVRRRSLARLAEELPLMLSDLEIDVSYRYPNGP